MISSQRRGVSHKPASSLHGETKLPWAPLLTGLGTHTSPRGDSEPWGKKSPEGRIQESSHPLLRFSELADAGAACERVRLSVWA